MEDSANDIQDTFEMSQHKSNFSTSGVADFETPPFAADLPNVKMNSTELLSPMEVSSSGLHYFPDTPKSSLLNPDSLSESMPVSRKNSYSEYSALRTPGRPREEILKWTAEFMLDCDTKACIVLLKTNKIPHLYIDDLTIMESVTTMRGLRRGDHLCSLINPVLGKLPKYDSFVSLIGRLNIVKFYHHFIVLDDVVEVTSDNIPLNKEGNPVTIAEYSGSPEQALDNLKNGGIRKLINNFASFTENPLNTYFCKSGIKGVWRLREHLDDFHRDEIVKNARILMEDFKTYTPFSANCEHAAFSVNPDNKWRSPQVPIFYWFCFHSFLVVMGLYHLLHGNFFVFHCLTTMPGIMRSSFNIMKKTTRLTENRKLYGWEYYSFLTQREVLEKSFATFVFMFIQLRFSLIPFSMYSITSLFCWVLLLWSFYAARWLTECFGELAISTCIAIFGGIPIFQVKSASSDLLYGNKRTRRNKSFLFTRTNVMEEDWIDSSFDSTSIGNKAKVA